MSNPKNKIKRQITPKIKDKAIEENYENIFN